MLNFDLDAFSKRFPNKVKFGFERIEKLLTKLGSPHLKLPPTIHVAGTNGKGSTIAFLRAIFETAGYTVHTYTSPHLLRFNERIVIAGREIGQPYLNQLLQECEKYHSVQDELTWFEFITVLAFLAFAQNPADILLLETGVGGRLDATNIIPSPLATAITSISYDHQTYLGATLREIAYAKAGIFKHGTQAFSVIQPEEVRDVLINSSKEQEAPLALEGQDWHVEQQAEGLLYSSTLLCPKVSLVGKHQIHNAGLALSIASFLKKTFTLKDKHLRAGIATAKWSGRLQNLSSSPLKNYINKGSEIWLDGAHNQGGAQALVNTLQAWDPLPTYFIIGMLNHKNHYSFLSSLNEVSQGFYFIPLSSSDKYMDPCQLAKVVNHKNSFAARSLLEAFKMVAEGSSTPARILICGSLYLAGDVLTMIEVMYGKIS